MSNQASLNAFVEAALADGRRDHMLASARKVEGFLRQLDAPGAVPAHLVGLTAFDLSDAMDRLEAAASRKEAA